MSKRKPFVSICTPTFNRRPFIPFIIKCFENQTYPRDKMEWIIVDDGTDKIEDLVAHIPQVKYYRYEEKMVLGKKRNICHEKATGDIIISMDDDDYYPPDRVRHAVDMLRTNPKAMCAGSSEMHIYFKHINQMYQFGPYGPNHCTAATFAFRRELLKVTSFDENAAVAEEKHFLKNYTVPFVQLDVTKTILVISHDHNSFNKKELLQSPSRFMSLSMRSVDDFIKEPDLKQFFLHDVDDLLSKYEPGKPENKQDVIKQIADIKAERDQMVLDHQKKQMEYNSLINHFTNENKVNDLTKLVQELTNENKQLREKVSYLEKKINMLIVAQVERSKKEKEKEKENQKEKDLEKEKM